MSEIVCSPVGLLFLVRWRRFLYGECGVERLLRWNSSGPYSGKGGGVF